MKKTSTSTTSFRKRPRRKLGRHRKYRGKNYKQYKGQGK